jgi:hypothetical protein
MSSSSLPSDWSLLLTSAESTISNRAKQHEERDERQKKDFIASFEFLKEKEAAEEKWKEKFSAKRVRTKERNEKSHI